MKDRNEIRNWAVLYKALIFIIFSVSPAFANTWVEVKGGDWSPERELLNEVQSKIEKYVKEKAAELHRSPLKPWNVYLFQFQGQHKAGKKYILINALCHDSKADLNSNFVKILDGGTCYFNLKYDPEKKEFFELFINGEA